MTDETKPNNDAEQQSQRQQTTTDTPSAAPNAAAADTAGTTPAPAPTTTASDEPGPELHGHPVNAAAILNQLHRIGDTDECVLSGQLVRDLAAFLAEEMAEGDEVDAPYLLDQLAAALVPDHDAAFAADVDANPFEETPSERYRRERQERRERETP